LDTFDHVRRAALGGLLRRAGLGEDFVAIYRVQETDGTRRLIVAPRDSRLRVGERVRRAGSFHGSISEMRTTLSDVGVTHSDGLLFEVSDALVVEG